VGCGQVVAGGGAPAAAAPLWTVDATLLQTAGQPLTACFVILTSLPPAGCSGVALRGVDTAPLPDVTQFGSGTLSTGPVRVTGTYADGVLTVTRQPQAVLSPSPQPETPSPPVSCSAPAGGWDFDKVSQEGFSRVAEYVNTADDGGTPRIDPSQRIMVAPFTGDLDRHRSELAALYDGPVCVELAKASHGELEAMAKEVTADVQRDGMGLLSSATGNAFGTAEVTVVAATASQREQIARQHNGLVLVESFLQPVDAD
jgi:hypothetical protein